MKAAWKAALLLLAAVTGLAAATPARAQPLYKEAPALAERVAHGDLPPVSQRLPRTPLLLQPLEEIGRYGGAWGMGMIGNGDGLLLYRTVDYEQLVRWDPQWRRVVPNLAQSFEVSPDAREFTFRLRPGLRWSDGKPFTAEDILFWYEDVLLNPDLTPRHTRWMMTGGQVGRVTSDGPEVVTFTFAAPNSLFLQRLASASDTKGPADFPKHALSRYHPRYNPDGIGQEIERAQVKDAAELFRLKAHLYHYSSSPEALLRRPAAVPQPGQPPQRAEAVPTLSAWVLDRLEPGDPPRYVFTRNPYYWKIDPAGQQLPYIDALWVYRVESPDELKRLVEAGRVDMQARHIATTLSADGMAALQDKGFRSFGTLSSESNTLVLAFNLTHADPAKRALFNTKDFRIALSQAIDRKALVAELFGQGDPYQAAPRPESRYFHERLAQQHTAHDPAAANARLDAAGLDRRGADGIRLRPDGQPVRFDILVRRDRGHYVRAVTRIADDWRAVGVDAQVQALDRGVINTARQRVDFDMTTAAPDGGIDPVNEPFLFMALTDDSVFGLGWVHWIEERGGTAAERPPQSVLDQLHLYDRIRETTDPDAQARLMREILDIAADQFFTIGVSLPPPGFGIVRADMRNIPPFMVDAWSYPTPGPTNPPQYFFMTAR